MLGTLRRVAVLREACLGVGVPRLADADTWSSCAALVCCALAEAAEICSAAFHAFDVDVARGAVGAHCRGSLQ